MFNKLNFRLSFFRTFLLLIFSFNSYATAAPDASENFTDETYNFSDTNYTIDTTEGKLDFIGNSDIGYIFTIWQGEDNHGGEFPQVDTPNYFENFEVSVDTYWESGEVVTGSEELNKGYGLIICPKTANSEISEEISFQLKFIDGS